MSELRKRILKIYDIYKRDDFLDADDMERRIKAERDAQIDAINEEYAKLLVPLHDLCIYLETGNIDAEHRAVMALTDIMLRELEDAADEMQHNRVYDADAVDALFSGSSDPMRMTDEDQHKAYARLMLSTLREK